MLAAAAGMGLGLGGSVLNSIGQAQGLRALAKERMRQMAEQEAVQKEANQQTLASITNNNQSLVSGNAEAAAIEPGQAYLTSVSGYTPFGLSAGQANMAAPQMEGSMSDLQAANIRLARSRAAGNAEQSQAIANSELEDKRNGLRNKSRSLSALYDIKDTIAFSKGEGLRTAGNLMKTAGSAAGGMGGMGGGGSGASVSDGSGDAPLGGWMTRRITRTPNGAEHAVA